MADKKMTGIPDGAIGTLDGLFYKIGLHGRAFYWDGRQWIKSDKTAQSVESDIAAKKHRFSH